ncbi:MAG: hypothetical protein JO113_08150 [Candidatus Eremiobacteraeota bacterium]|nr:hypothetical protein [Candidatus Eremiobacteraeota bacterium]
MIAAERGRLDEARRIFAEALALATMLGADVQKTAIRANMADLEFRFGNTDRALDLMSAIKAEGPGLYSFTSTIAVLVDSAAFNIALDDIAAACRDAREGLRLARGADPFLTAAAVQRLATVAARSGDPYRGARLRGYVDAWYQSGGSEREAMELHMDEILMAALRERLTDAEIETLAAEGAQLSEDQAVAEALAVAATVNCASTD